MKKQSNARLALRFVAFMKGSALKYLGSIICVMVTVAISLLTPLLLAGTVDAITNTVKGATDAAVNLPGFLAGWFEARGGVSYIASHVWNVALVLLIANLISGVFAFLRGKWLAETSEKTAERMRNALYEHLQQMDYDYHVKAETGDLIQRCTTDLETVRRFIANQLIEIVRTVLMVALALTMMIRIHGTLTLISLLLVPFLFLFAFLFFRWVQKLFLASDEADGHLSAMLQESLTGVRVVRAFGREKYEYDRFVKHADEVYDKNVALSEVLAIYWSVSDATSMTQTGLTLIFGVFFALKGEMTTGNVLTFVSYISMLIFPIRQLGRILSDFGKALVSLRRMYAILDAEVEQDDIADPSTDCLNTDLYQEIEFRHVSFAYPNHSEILKDISFTAKPGQTIAILGATGSGKTTLMNLFQRLYDPKGGQILIGGNDIRNISKDWLRTRIGYVLQEPFLYSRSIMDNLKITEPDAQREAIDEVVRTTASDGFINEFEKGFDTMVGERGVTLSGGQKQRIAIARTLMRDSDILILDDSLSAVDTETDKAIREALQERRKTGGRVPTTFIISHRITTLADADQILVLENGVIAQSGTHEQLIREDGLYRRVYRIQAALEEELNAETEA